MPEDRAGFTSGEMLVKRAVEVSRKIGGARVQKDPLKFNGGVIKFIDAEQVNGYGGPCFKAVKKKV